MQGFTKLFSSIVDSTIWREDPYTKVVWITMLAKADRNGIVSCSLPGLADAARVTLKQCQDALVVFLSPDEFSRTKDFEGRRIMEVDGGWVLLNYMKFRAIQNEDEVRIATAERVRRHRAKFASQSDVTDVTDCRRKHSPSAEPYVRYTLVQYFKWPRNLLFYLLAHHKHAQVNYTQLVLLTSEVT